MANQIHPLAIIDPDAKLGDGNIIGPFCVIDKNVVIGDNNILMNSVTLHFGTRLGNGNEIFPGASLSTKPQDLKFKGEETTCEIGDNNSIRENVTISRGTASKGKTIVGNGNLLMENMHVGHDCVIGNGCIIGNSTKIAGEVIIDDFATISATCPTSILSFVFGRRIRPNPSFGTSFPKYSDIESSFAAWAIHIVFPESMKACSRTRGASACRRECHRRARSCRRR